jgi:predicted ATPase
LYLALRTVMVQHPDLRSSASRIAVRPSNGRSRWLVDADEELPDDAKHNLPKQTTPFIGRSRELLDLAQLLSDSSVSMITILAPGGMGKTRLALKLAQRQIARFPDGAYFVPLAPVSSPEYAIPVIAEYTRYQFQQDSRAPRQQLLDYLSNKHMLVVLDNFEHLLGEAALLTEIVQAAPGVKVVVTSREKLNLSGETVYALDGMDFPPEEIIEDAPDFDAIQLFVQSARARPDYVLPAEDVSRVAEICRLVGGMPLAIELAAGWVDVLPVAKIADEIRRGLDILETEMRDVPSRHRSVRATFDYTWSSLSPAEQMAFARLSVFRGGFRAEAAEVVARADVRLLRKLVNKALVSVRPFGRYEIHELLRQYGEERLDEAGESDSTRDAHCACYTEFLHQREADARGRRQLEAFYEIEADYDNIRLAWDWAVAHKKVGEIGKALDTLGMFYALYNRWGSPEAQSTFRRAVRAFEMVKPAGGQGIVLAESMGRLLWLSFGLGHTETIELAERSIAILRKLDGGHKLAFALWLAGNTSAKPTCMSGASVNPATTVWPSACSIWASSMGARF